MNKTLLALTDFELNQQRVVIREDFNVPLLNGVITSDARLIAAIPTIQQALFGGAAVILLAHLGRPIEGSFDEALSLKPVALRLSELLQQPVRLAKEALETIKVKPGEIVLCENVRFNAGEKANDPPLAKRYAALGDIYVMDAFATAHRAEASTEGVLHYAPKVCAGPLLLAELDALQKALTNPAQPMLAIIGGAKVSSKLQLLERISDKADLIIVGGGILNTFMLAAGLPIGASLVETALIPTASALMEKLKARGGTIPLPTDVMVAKRFASDAPATCKAVADVAADDLILDIGPVTAKAWAHLIQSAKTILWNGPVGVFEFPAFAHGTETMATAIAQADAFTIAGGGDTIAAIEKWQLSAAISYISTGGGAFLEYLEGKTLPAVAALQKRTQ